MWLRKSCYLQARNIYDWYKQLYWSNAYQWWYKYERFRQVSFHLILKRTIRSFSPRFSSIKKLLHCPISFFFDWIVDYILMSFVRNWSESFNKGWSVNHVLKSRNKIRTWLSNKVITLCYDSIETVYYRMKCNLFLVYNLLFRIKMLGFHNSSTGFGVRENIVRFHE
jgi:hypothetical protein